jgi:hypothetical protein
VNGPTVTWVEPPANVCAFKNDRLIVVADSTKKVKQVAFTDNGKRIGVDKRSADIFSVAWKTAKLKKGKHTLVATVTDAAGRKAAAGRVIKVCK